VSTYKVLARKWRPQRFDDVIGQRGVTQTLRNAIATNRIAQSFVFAGPRGVGKTTTARILARGLNCVQGPTADPCGTCDACLEIAEGRDMDVLEIDAATHTQVDKVRDIIIAGLGMAPVRDRHKIFIIDEVHRLSPQSFDALLKSIEEPPPHVVFMMATTEIEKVPATIQSRSQVFELKTIGLAQIADQLRTIVAAEGIEIDEAALILVARAGDGSMRDAQSALDQVLAFSRERITADDVSTVLGLVRRDVLFDMADAVASENGAAAFDLAATAVEAGYDLRLVVRELARLTRDVLVVSIDASRAADPEIAAEGERERLMALAARFSVEDLMRAFDVLTKAELEIRGSAYPRYHLEMALLRWIHLRKLVPLSDLIQQMDKGGPSPARPASGQQPARPAPVAPRGAGTNAARAASVHAVQARRDAARPADVRSDLADAPAAPPDLPHPADAGLEGPNADTVRRQASATAAKPVETTGALPDVRPVASSEFKDAFLEEVRRQKKFFHGTVIAQAQRIDVEGDRVNFVFAPQHRALRSTLEQSRPLLETIATQLAGRRMTVTAAEGSATAGPAGAAASGDAAAETGRHTALRQQALADSSVQAMLDVFAAEIKEVEER
jgi:DNA polymerase-3 subunit gamma/tau